MNLKRPWSPTFLMASSCWGCRPRRYPSQSRLIAELLATRDSAAESEAPEPNPESSSTADGDTSTSMCSLDVGRARLEGFGQQSLGQ